MKNSLHGLCRPGLALLCVGCAGAEPVIGTPEAFGKLIVSDLAKWGRIAKQANIRAE